MSDAKYWFLFYFCLAVIAAFGTAIEIAGRDYRRYQKKMWRLYRQGHDIGTLPGGHMIHFSVCWCHE